MPKVGKPKLAKTTRKTPIGAVPKSATQQAGKGKGAKVAQGLKAVAPTATKASVKTPIGASEKKVSQKLLETIEKRKKAAGKVPPMFSRPPGRRGRRPKGAVEYTPEHQEE